MHNLSEMAKASQPTTAQLRRGAANLSYRTQQLSNAAVLLRTGFPAQFERNIGIVVRNSLVESALANARVMAYFLHKRPDAKYLHVFHFKSGWTHEISEQIGRIIGLVSEYLAPCHPRKPKGRGAPG